MLSQDALAGLSKYSYKGVDKSILSKNVLNPFWNQFVKLWPLWVAPNTITLAGLSLVIFNVLTLIYYDPTYLAGTGQPSTTPQWLYYTWAGCLFLYQSLDAIDGKQARRTGMASALGEMFDHGCDAINTSLEVVLAGNAMNLGRSWWTVAIVVTSHAAFYLTTWEEYYTGQLFLGFISGPVEGILMIVAVFTVSGYSGPQFWDQPLASILRIDESSNDLIDSILNLRLNELFLVFGAIGLLFNITNSCINVLQARRKKGLSFMEPFLRLLPFAISAGLNLLWMAGPSYRKSSIVKSPLLMPFMFAWGLQFAHQVGWMILAHVTSQPLPFVDDSWIFTAIVALDANSQSLFGIQPRLQQSQRDVEIIVYLALAASFFRYGNFVVSVIDDITNHLGIACFRVQKRDQNGQWIEASIVNKQKSQ